jgi:tetratricopeptide (TPR) repeat protein
VGKQKTLEIIGLSAASLLVGFGIWWFYVHLSPDDMRSEGDDYYDSERYSEALRFYEMANEHGALDMFQTHRLGKMYRDGKGVAQDGAKAVEWFRKSVEKGNGYAANDLGVMYMQGKGVAQDYAKAVEWFRKSANETYGYEGKYNLAYMIENGYGVTADVDEALRLYKQLLDSDIPAYYVKDWARKRINAIEERRAEEERQRKLSEIGIALQATIEKFYVGDPVYMDCVTHTGFLWMKENNRSWGVVEQVSHDGNRIMVRVTDREWCARGTEWYYASQWKK